MRLQHEKPATAAVFSHDGKQIISVGKDRVGRVWDADTGKGLGTWQLDAADPTTIVLSRKGDVALVAFNGGRIDGYELPAGTKRFTLPGQEPNPKRPSQFVAVSSMAVGADDKTLLAANSDGEVTLWDLTTAKALKSHSTAPTPVVRRPVVLTPDAKLFGYEPKDSKELVFFNATDGTEAKKLDLRTDPGARFLSRPRSRAARTEKRSPS